MPTKIKSLWVICIIAVFSGFAYFSYMGKVDEARQKAEVRSKQQSHNKEKLEAKKIENKGRTFKIDPIHEIKELIAQGKVRDIYSVDESFFAGNK